VTVEYHWLEGQYDRLPALIGDLVRRQVVVIATPGVVPSLAAKERSRSSSVSERDEAHAVMIDLTTSLSSVKDR
jgi:putative ABC transport system substrate-binding protein